MLGVMNDAHRAERIYQVLPALREQIVDAPSLRELASIAAMSRFRFSRTFNAVVGMSMRTYIRRERIKRAEKLILETTKSLTMIAIDCGFYDLPHLDKAFRRELGVSPLTYRLQHSGASADRRRPVGAADR